MNKEIEQKINAIDITGPVPTEETERQYYYIAKARTYIAAKEKKLGRKLTFCVNTFGCQMNLQNGIA